MGEFQQVSFEELNAFIDGELDLGASARVLAAIDSSDELKRQACELRALRDVTRHAYDIKRINPVKLRTGLLQGKWRHGIAAGLLALGVLGGWQGHGYYQNEQGGQGLSWDRLAQAMPHGNSRQLVLHVGDANVVRFENTVEEARTMLVAAKSRGQRIDIEILANGPGLDMLRAKTSQVAGKLAQLQAEFPNFGLVACGLGLQRLSDQGADTKLLPGVETTDSALNEIVRRMNKGWAYLRV